MNFSELTRVMLHSMDFFELRRTAARYGVSYQGIRRNKLIRDIERKIAIKNNPNHFATMVQTPLNGMLINNDSQQKRKVANSKGAPKVNTISRNSFTRV